MYLAKSLLVSHLEYVLFCFEGRVSSCDWPGMEHIKILLPLPPKSGIKDICHYTQLESILDISSVLK